MDNLKMQRKYMVPHSIRSLEDCHNVEDFRELAWRKLPFPVFHYIDGAADDELTKARNTAAFADVDLVPNVLAGVEEIDTSIEIMGRKTALPLILSPTALQRLFHWQGERAVAKVAERHNLWFGISSLSSVSIEEIGAEYAGPKMLQYYFHRDRGLNSALLERARDAKFDAVALTRAHVQHTARKIFKAIDPLRALKASDLSEAGWMRRSFVRERFGVDATEGAALVAMNLLTQRRRIHACVEAVLSDEKLPSFEFKLDLQLLSKNSLRRLTEALRIAGNTDKAVPKKLSAPENNTAKKLVKGALAKVEHGQIDQAIEMLRIDAAVFFRRTIVPPAVAARDASARDASAREELD